MSKRHAIYECDICNCYHPADWDGDCRDDENRFASPEDYAERVGVTEGEIQLQSMEEVQLATDTVRGVALGSITVSHSGERFALKIYNSGQATYATAADMGEVVNALDHFFGSETFPQHDGGRTDCPMCRRMSKHDHVSRKS